MRSTQRAGRGARPAELIRRGHRDLPGRACGRRFKQRPQLGCRARCVPHTGRLGREALAGGEQEARACGDAAGGCSVVPGSGQPALLLDSGATPGGDPKHGSGTVGGRRGASLAPPASLVVGQRRDGVRLDPRKSSRTTLAAPSGAKARDAPFRPARVRVRHEPGPEVTAGAEGNQGHRGQQCRVSRPAPGDRVQHSTPYGPNYLTQIDGELAHGVPVSVWSVSFPRPRIDFGLHPSVPNAADPRQLGVRPPAFDRPVLESVSRNTVTICSEYTSRLSTTQQAPNARNWSNSLVFGLLEGP